jgi:hypothetical protein
MPSRQTALNELVIKLYRKNVQLVHTVDQQGVSRSGRSIDALGVPVVLRVGFNGCCRFTHNVWRNVRTLLWMKTPPAVNFMSVHAPDAQLYKRISFGRLLHDSLHLLSRFSRDSHIQFFSLQEHRLTRGSHTSWCWRLLCSPTSSIHWTPPLPTSSSNPCFFMEFVGLLDKLRELTFRWVLRGLELCGLIVSGWSVSKCVVVWLVGCIGFHGLVSPVVPAGFCFSDAVLTSCHVQSRGILSLQQLQTCACCTTHLLCRQKQQFIFFT